MNFGIDSKRSLTHSTSYGYGGGRIHVVDDKQIAYICGKGILFLDLYTGLRKYFWPPEYRNDLELKKNKLDKNDESQQSKESLDIRESVELVLKKSTESLGSIDG